MDFNTLVVTFREKMVERIRLVPDQHHLRDVGQLVDGRYFWIDLQLNTEGHETRDFIATYTFNADGDLLDHEICDLGLRSSSSAQHAANAVMAKRKQLKIKRNLLGRQKRCSFWVKPFSIEAFGLSFGLVLREQEEGEMAGEELVDAMPGCTLMFYPPWPDGSYDT
ncbi:hypothetical protein [Leisingera sp. ANG-M6]|uniref:hypothetical protein n=1 Tax=Leisingera sp. ANG-M6 TaxID=1577900 RepID=UPI00057E7315|nr:hypothetical protein [Leisingera sp. ANG-M6]KIC29643.1 hypothetical protein RA24_05970 [Leisingera sp. ANG-M6]